MKRLLRWSPVLAILATLTLLTACSPSGLDAPVGDLPGWNQVFLDDFLDAATLTNGTWLRYHGTPGASGDHHPGCWAQSQAVVDKGMLTLQGRKHTTIPANCPPLTAREKANGQNFRMVTAGVNLPVLKQIFGKYEVRVRMDKGGVAYALLLWPSGDTYPPEIDFHEDAKGAAAESTVTLHHANASGTGTTKVQRKLNLDFSEWHTMGVEWMPGKLTFTVDGEPWSTIEHAQVPKQPMVLAMQTQAWECGAFWVICTGNGSPAEVDMQIDWVSIYEPTGGVASS